MEPAPSLISRAFEFVIAVFSSAWGIWGGLSTAMPLLTAFATAFMPVEVRAKMELRLPSTPAHRRAVFIVIGAMCLMIASFQAFDEVNADRREARGRIAAVEAAQAKSRLQAEKRSQMQAFYQQAILLEQEIMRSTFEALASNLDRADQWGRDVSVWLRRNLGEAAQARFHDPAAMQAAARSRGVFDFSEGRLLVLIGFRDNLRAMIENERWVGPR